MSVTYAAAGGLDLELGHAPIREVPLRQCWPSPENDTLYRPVDQNDPDIIALAESVKDKGVLEPLVITLDGFIVSGHRRHAAAKLAGLETVPCRTLDVRRADDIDGFIKLLREFNRQREKSHDERLRETIIDIDPAEAHQSMVEFRERAAGVRVTAIEMRDVKTRATVSPAKVPFVFAIQNVLTERRQYWPLSDRQIHYALLNRPPLRHAGKPKSTYRNDLASYKSLTELLTRLRLTGVIPMNAIADETRPVDVWPTHRHTSTYCRRAMEDFLKGYWRDLMQSQPNHVEIVGEKNTVAGILNPVAMEFTIPITTGRGYCSLPPRAAIAERFRKSGKEKLILLIVSDFDPDGEEIAHSFARSIRDDFGVAEVHPIKVALTAQQVKEHKLPPGLKAKVGSVHHKRFTDKYGTNVFELEALPPATLQKILRDAVTDVIDVDAFNRELLAEQEDSTHLAGIRRTVQDVMKEIHFGDPE